MHTNGNLGYDGGLHCDLRVSDLSRALGWYQEVLGFEVLHHVAETGWAELQTPVSGVRVLGAARARLEARGDVRFDGETCTIEGWVRLATIYDPDGNTLMLYEDLSG